MNLQEARALVAQLEPGVRVIVTVDGRDIDCQVHRRSSSEPGGFGHPDSARVTVGFGPGRWNMEVTAQSIADGFATIRIVEWDDESTQVDQDDDGEGGVIEKPTWPDGCPITLNELPHGDVAPGHVNCRRYSGMEVEAEDGHAQPYGDDTIGIVDEEAGGVIAYVHRHNEERILDALRMHRGVQL